MNALVGILAILFLFSSFEKVNLKVLFYNNPPSLIVTVSKLAKNFTKNNSIWVIKCFILSLKIQKIIWTLSSIFVQALPADFCKNTSNEKNSNSPLLLDFLHNFFQEKLQTKLVLILLLKKIAIITT
jgi:hypothetical protein